MARIAARHGRGAERQHRLELRALHPVPLPNVRRGVVRVGAVATL